MHSAMTSDITALTFRPELVTPGERWVYSAGANVVPGCVTAPRITEEVPDLRALTAAQAVVVVLSHQGSYRDGSAGSLGHVAQAWRSLGLPVRLMDAPWEVGDAVRGNPGSITLLPNTRLSPGEEDCDPDLARAYATLGAKAIVGGFSKSHRRNASNFGLMEHLPTWISRGLAMELDVLQPIRTGPLGALVLGGMKREKVLALFSDLTSRAHCVLPTGGVLNALLHAQGIGVGNSRRPHLDEEERRRLVQAVHTLGARIILPHEVLLTEEISGSSHWAPLSVPIPAGWAIRDLRWSPEHLGRIAEVLRSVPTAVIAGPPGDVRGGFVVGAQSLSNLLAPLRDGAFFLGGDTCEEIEVTGTASPGGGAALEYLGRGTCLVVEHLRSIRLEGTFNDD